MTYRALVLAALAAAAGCADESSDPACDPTAEPCTFTRTVSTIEVAAGVEDEDVCQSWTLDNETELFVTEITQRNGGAYHHANWFFVPDDTYVLPDGTWSCSGQAFDELTAAILGGYLFALSTQSPEETQAIPAGGAIRIPPRSRVIGSSHLLNATEQPVTTDMIVELRTVPPDAVAAALAPARIEYHDLQLDPNAKSSFTTECMIADTYQETMGKPWEYVLYYVLTHYHELGIYGELSIIGGERDGELIFRHDGYGENFGLAIDPPLDLPAIGATGLRFTCGYDNPRDDVVRWGIGDQEMCVLALQASTDMGWQGDVPRGTGNDVETAPDGELRHSGACSIFGVPWDHAKPGGNGM